MIKAFLEAFGEIGLSALGEIRHELLGAYFGRNFEPHPTNRQPADLTPDREPEHDPLGRTRDLGIDR